MFGDVGCCVARGRRVEVLYSVESELPQPEDPKKESQKKKRRREMFPEREA